MNTQAASSSLVLDRRTTWLAPEGHIARPLAATAPVHPRGIARLRRWFTRTFDFRDAFTPTSAW